MLLCAARAGLEVGEYAARLVKKAVVGNGNAEKAQVHAMVERLLPGRRRSPAPTPPTRSPSRSPTPTILASARRMRAITLRSQMIARLTGTLAEIAADGA